MAIVCDFCDRKHCSVPLLFIDKLKFDLVIENNECGPGLLRSGKVFRVDLCVDCRQQLAAAVGDAVSAAEDAISSFLVNNRSKSGAATHA